MANATAIVKKGAVRPEDVFTNRSCATLAAATTFYQHAMLGTVGGYIAKFDDTQSMSFAGLVRGDQGSPLLGPGTAGDGTINIDVYEPKRFELAISGVAVTDIGRVVYALDDQTGTLSASATTYANVVGIVKDVVASGVGLVEPFYGRANSEPIQVFAANGAIQVKRSTVFITKGSAAALTIVDPTTGVHDGLEITVMSTTAFAHTVTYTTGFNAGGAAKDVATFAGNKGDNMVFVAYGGVWYLKSTVSVTPA